MPAFVSPEALSTLIGSIYDCALDPSRWDQTLGEMREALECQNAAIRLNDIRHHRFLILSTWLLTPNKSMRWGEWMHSGKYAPAFLD
jgi:hypothetical protein